MEIGLPFGAFLAAFLVLIPLPSHWRARNVATTSIIAWLAVVNVILGVNAIVWANNVEIQLVSWCDIVIRVSVGSNIALPAACFCLCMHLERVASVRVVHSTSSDKRKRTIVDLILCYGVPLVYICLYYVVQGHRFDIVENFGCRPESYVSIPEFFLFRLPPILFSLATMVLAVMAFKHFYRRRATFAAHLQMSTALTPARYFRLMALALVQMFWSLLVTVLDMWFSYRDGLRPWISWANVHSNFSRIGQFPTVFIPTQDLIFTYFLWWTIPVSAYLFFVFFAFGKETMSEYSACVRWVRRAVFRRKMDPSSAPNPGSLPLYRSSGPQFKSLFVSVSKSSVVVSDRSPTVSSQKGIVLLDDSERTPLPSHDGHTAASVSLEKSELVGSVVPTNSHSAQLSIVSLCPSSPSYSQAPVKSEFPIINDTV